MEISWVHDNQMVFDFSTDRKVKKNLDEKGLSIEGLKQSKLYKFTKENPCEAVALGLVASIGIATVANITLNAGATIAVGAGFAEIDKLFQTCISAAKKALVCTVIFNTIKDAIMISWRNGGAKMSWDDIFGSVFKNLAILGVGLAIDKAAWALYGALS